MQKSQQNEKKQSVKFNDNDEHEANESKLEENECVYDETFFSKLNELRQIIINLFTKYNLKYSVSSTIEYAISECRDEYLSISAVQMQKIDELEQYKMQKENEIKQENDNLQSQLKLKDEKHDIEIKQIKCKYEKTMKKLIEKTKKETKEELEKQFNETVKSRARKAMSQIRDGQSKTIQSLQKKMNRMQS